MQTDLPGVTVLLCVTCNIGLFLYRHLVQIVMLFESRTAHFTRSNDFSKFGKTDTPEVTTLPWMIVLCCSDKAFKPLIIIDHQLVFASIAVFFASSLFRCHN